MPRVTTNGIEIEYETHGSSDDPVVLLIMGLGGQLTLWPVEFCDALVARGFRVIRYDNRDIGLSTKFDHAGLPDIAKITRDAIMKKPVSVAYTLNDMAADANGLLEALGIERAHIVGASMGGMIAQLVAAKYPQRVLSLTSIMSSTGNPTLPPPKMEALAILTDRPASTDEEDMVNFGVKAARVIGSPGYPAAEQRLRDNVRRDFRRSFSPGGYSRQMAAIIANGDRRDILKQIRCPTLVIHGDADPLVPAEAGRDTARSISGAELMVIPGMGHDLPLELHHTIADAIADLAAKAQATA
jgi:pimeloyl-ACP methyl ester carboxylesterase